MARLFTTFETYHPNLPEPPCISIDPRESISISNIISSNSCPSVFECCLAEGFHLRFILRPRPLPWPKRILAFVRLRACCNVIWKYVARHVCFEIKFTFPSSTRVFLNGQELRFRIIARSQWAVQLSAHQRILPFSTWLLGRHPDLIGTVSRIWLRTSGRRHPAHLDPEFTKYLYRLVMCLRQSSRTVSQGSITVSGIRSLLAVNYAAVLGTVDIARVLEESH